MLWNDLSDAYLASTYRTHLSYKMRLLTYRTYEIRSKMNVKPAAGADTVLASPCGATNCFEFLAWGPVDAVALSPRRFVVASLGLVQMDLLKRYRFCILLAMARLVFNPPRIALHLQKSSQLLILQCILRTGRTYFMSTLVDDGMAVRSNSWRHLRSRTVKWVGSQSTLTVRSRAGGVLVALRGHAGSSWRDAKAPCWSCRKGLDSEYVCEVSCQSYPDSLVQAYGVFLENR